MSNVRVRFAPSPTGYLHIGGVRTALYSWLYARQQGGTFVLRIEDTDRDRSTEESVRIVLESMRWLGLTWDEGPEANGPHAPYYQSQRLDVYRAHAEKLVQSGHAYRCYASKDEIEAARAAHTAAGGKAGFRFQSPWRDRTEPPADPGAPHVFRFKSPRTGATGWDDMVKGRIEVPNDQQQDFVLLRPDGMPLYNFGCVVDDHEMGITHVCRGDDHVVNTPIQLLIYEGLGAPPPKFAHLPMVLAPNGEKLSKRHAAVGVLEYRDMGYVADSVLNYLVRLGWSHGDQEIFTRQEQIEKFDWEHVGSTAGKYDGKKFAYVQAEHFRMLSDDALAEGVVPFLSAIGVTVSPDDATLRATFAPMRARSTTFMELAAGIDYFFRPPTMDEKAQAKFLVKENAVHLRDLVEVVRAVAPFDAANLEATVNGFLESTGRQMKQVAQPARVAMTGRTQSPGLFDVMVILGKDETVSRLEAAIVLAEKSA